MRHESTGYGGGKVILLGEHAVVHGVPAIAAGLRRGVTSVARVADIDTLHIAPWGRTVLPDGRSDDPLARAMASALESYRGRPPLYLDVQVDLPPGAGLGCSAAIGVSLLDAVDKVLGIERSRRALAEHALQWERFFHGVPSGIDNAAAALGGLLGFQRTTGPRRISSKAPLHLVVAHSGQRSETKEMVARVSRQLDERPDCTRRRFDEVRTLVRDAETAIERGDAAKLGRSLDHNHEVLRALGLSTPRLHGLCEAARSAGALGAKVTGAGGGGCIVALAENAGAAAAIAKALDADAFIEEVASAA